MAGRMMKLPHVCKDRERFYVRGLPASVDSPGGFDSRLAAEIWLKSKSDLLAAIREAELQSGRGRERACLCCTRPFLSEGAHNRLCNPCRQRGSAEGSPVGYSFGAMTGRRKSA